MNCSNCIYWRTVDAGKTMGKCHGSTPQPQTPLVVIPPDQSLVKIGFKSGPVIWPVTGADDTCPKHTPPMNLPRQLSIAN